MNSNWRRWLFVSPHADDSEFGCGGLLAQLARRPDLEVELVVLTSREQTTGESAEVTRQYQRDALDALGLFRANISLSRLHARRLPDLHEEVRETLTRVKRNFRPDVIFTTPNGDRMQDHHAVAQEVARVFRGDSVLEYEVVSSSIAFAPSVYLEVTEDDLRLKVAALHCHRGQSHKSYFEPDVIRSLARLRGAHSSRFSYAEAFRNQVLLMPSLEVRMNESEKLSYDESRGHLVSRIEAHRQRSGRDVEEFILEHAAPLPGETVVDLCCGTGKQVLTMAPLVGSTGRVIGLDLQQELLDEGRRQAKELPQVSFQQHDANHPLPLESGTVDLLTCCYGIYYIQDLEALVADIARVLEPDGRVFVIGPARDNNEEIRRLHSEVTGHPEPVAITEYRGRIEGQVLPLLERHTAVRTLEFKNELRFTTVEDFVRYYRATPLLAKSSNNEAERETWVRAAAERVGESIQEHGAFVVRKVAVALLGQKNRRRASA